MRWIRFALLTVLMSSLSCAARAQPSTFPATQPIRVSLFDPAKHMRVSEVKEGMKGYGLSVFAGTAIERFDVEVISVLHNFNPQYDVVLIRCQGQNLEHTGAIAGMSGSPIYLSDEQGRSRLIGAFAYGWSLMKDPIAGVQPIEYMLEVGATLRPEPAATQQASQSSNARPASGTKLARFDPFRSTLKLSSAAERRDGRTANQLLGSGDVPQLRPLSTPLMTAGLSPKLIEQFQPVLKQYGLVALQAGGIGGGAGPTTGPDVKLEPGSVMGAPLLTGDVEMTAIGTCTEVLGDRIFGFGHPFNNEGPITLPMGSGKINGIIASLSQSFKIGALTQFKGTLIADQAVGVAGRLGQVPPTVPIEIHVIYEDGSLDATYHFNAVSHPRLTPALTALAVQSALNGRRDLPQYHTVKYDLAMQFANDRSVNLKDVVVNQADSMLLIQLANVVDFAGDNPFERVPMKSVKGTIRVTSEAHEADVLSVNLAKTKYRPGDTLKAFVRYRPFRQGESVMPIELNLPRDLKDGQYALTVSDRDTYLQQEMMARPFLFDAQSTDDIFAVVKQVASIRSDALYIRLMRQSDGISIGRTALPKLPGSRRQILIDSGRSDISEFVSAVTKIMPTEVVMTGSADFQIEIDAEDHVEVGGQRSPRAAEPRSITMPGGIEPGRPRGIPAPGQPNPPRAEPPTPPEAP